MLTDKIIQNAPKSLVQPQLQTLRDVIHPPRIKSLADVKIESAFLSDVEWVNASTGWGKPSRNHFWFDKQNTHSVLLRLAGKFYRKGLYAHSPSIYTFDLNGSWKSFATVVGLQDGAHSQGSAVFSIHGDGRELIRSKVLRTGDQQDLRVTVSNIQTLELRTRGGEGHNHNSWAIWGNPSLNR